MDLIRNLGSSFKKGVGAVSSQIEVDDIAFILGFLLIGFGVAGFNRHAGKIVAGVILLLSVKPLWSWLK